MSWSSFAASVMPILTFTRSPGGTGVFGSSIRMHAQELGPWTSCSGAGPSLRMRKVFRSPRLFNYAQVAVKWSTTALGLASATGSGRRGTNNIEPFAARYGDGDCGGPVTGRPIATSVAPANMRRETVILFALESTP